MLKSLVRRLQVAFVRVELSRARFAQNPEATMEAELELGRLCGEDHSLDEAEAHLIAARQIATKLDNQPVMARSAIGLGAISIARKNYQAARTALEAELPRIRQLGDHQLLADAMLKVGVANDKLGCTAEAIAFWEEAVTVAKGVRDTFRQSEALMNLGGVAYRDQRYDHSYRNWLEALTLCRSRHDVRNVAELSFFLGVVSRRMGRPDEATQFLADSKTYYLRLGQPELAARSEEYLADLDADTKDRTPG
jgi:tetratricopeptide (TPR) repeat protein